MKECTLYLELIIIAAADKQVFFCPYIYDKKLKLDLLGAKFMKMQPFSELVPFLLYEL